MTLYEKVAQWGADKGIHGPNGKGTYRGQYAKFLEEMGELFAALEKSDVKEIRDALGDLQVVAIQACAIADSQIIFTKKETFDPDEDFEFAAVYAIENLAAFMPSGAFFKVRSLSLHIGHDPDECLEEAYAVISKRSGSMLGGTFVKYVSVDDDLGELDPAKACGVNGEACESCQ